MQSTSMLSQNNPSVLCLKMLLKLKSLLRLLEKNNNLKRKRRWDVVNVVHSLLVKLLELGEIRKLEEWLQSIKEVLHSVSVHFLRLIILATRRFEYLNKMKGEINDILKMLYDLFGFSEESLVLVIVKASNALGGERNSYDCQFQLFSLMASEVFSFYLTKEDLKEGSSLVNWSVTLARLWLMTCSPPDKAKVQNIISGLLPQHVKLKGKRKMSTKGLLKLSITQLVKKFGLTNSKAIKEMDMLLVEEEGSHAYLELLEMANKIDETSVQLRLIMGNISEEEKETLSSKELFSPSSDWTASTPDRPAATTVQNSPEVNADLGCSQDYIPSSLINERSGKELAKNKLKRKGTIREGNLNCATPDGKHSTDTGEQVDEKEKDLKVRKVSPSAKSKGLPGNAEVRGENTEVSSKTQSLDGNHSKTSKLKTTRAARTKAKTLRKCKEEYCPAKGGPEEDFSLRLESDMENPSPKINESGKLIVNKKSMNAVKRVLLTSTDTESSFTTANEITTKESDQHKAPTNNKDDLDQTVAKISGQDVKASAIDVSLTEEKSQDRQVSTAGKKQQTSVTKGKASNASSEEDFENLDCLGKQKLTERNPKSFLARTDTKRNGTGHVKGVKMLDTRMKLPEGWKRLVQPRITLGANKTPRLRIDVQVVSPDGKSHKCKKEVMRHQEKHYPENSMSKKEIELWYKVEPQLKEKVMKSNKHLMKHLEQRKQAMLQARTLKSYTPLKVNIKSKNSVKQKLIKKESDLVRSPKLLKSEKLENNAEAKDPSSLEQNQEARPSNVHKSERKDGWKSSLEGGERREFDVSKPPDVQDPYEFTEEEDTGKEFCPTRRTSCVQNPAVKSEINVKVDVDSYQENREQSHRENLPKVLEQAGSRSQNTMAKDNMLEGFPIKREMSENNVSISAHDEPGSGDLLPTHDNDANEDYSSIGEDESQNDSTLFSHPCFDSSCVKPSGLESVSSQEPEPNSSLDDVLAASPVLFIIPELCKAKLKEGDIICTKVNEVTAQKNSVCNARDEGAFAKGLTVYPVNSGKGISGTPLRLEEKLVKTDSIEMWKETDLAGCTSGELTNGTPFQDLGDKKENCEIKNLRHLKASQQNDHLFIESQDIKICSTPTETVQEVQSPGLSTIKGSSCKKTLQGVVSASNVSGHHQDAQPLVNDIQQVPVLKDKATGERKALVTIPPIVSGKDILLELKWYKIVPSEVGRSFLLDSYIVTLSHQEILPPTILEKELLAAREIQLARSSKEDEGKSTGTFNDHKGKSCYRRLLGEFTNSEKMQEGSLKQADQNKRAKVSYQDERVSDNLRAVGEDNSMEEDGYGTPMLNSLVQHLEDSQNSEKGRQTLNQGSSLTTDDPRTALNSFATWSTDGNTNHLNNYTSVKESQLALNTLSSDHEDLSIIEADSANNTKYFSYAGRIIMPGKNLKKCLYSCHGSHLSQLKEKARIPVELTLNPSPCHICSQHQRREAWHSDRLFNPSLLDLSCPICQLTLEEVWPCTFHPELIQLGEGVSEVDLPSPLEHMTETVRMIYWEYVGILLSLFPGKDSLPLPMSWNYMSTCSVHAVINHKDLVATVSSQSGETESKSGQDTSCGSKQERNQDYCQNTNLSTSSQCEYQEFGKTAKVSKHSNIVKSNSSEVIALSTEVDSDLGKRKSTCVKSLSRSKKDPSVVKQQRNTKSLHFGKGKEKVSSTLNEKANQSGKCTTLQISHSNLSSGKGTTVSEAVIQKTKPISKQWKINSMILKKLFKTKARSDKDTKGKVKRPKKCTAKKKKTNKKCIQNISTSKFIEFPNVHSSDMKAICKNQKSTQLTHNFFDKSLQVKKKKGDNKATTSSCLQKELQGEGKSIYTHLPKVNIKENKVKTASDVPSIIAGGEFDALERFKKHQKRALERSRKKSCVSAKL